MMLEVLTPRVQDAEQANVGSQVLGVASTLKERRGTGAEEQVVEQPLVLQHECGQFMGQREDDVEVGHRQQLGGARGQPSGACVALALGTVPVATRVIGDGLMAAAGASIAMSTKCCRAATDDHLAVLGGEMRSMPIEEAAAGSTEDVGHLKGGRLIPSRASSNASPRLTSTPQVPPMGLRQLASADAIDADRPSCRPAWRVRAEAKWW